MNAAAAPDRRKSLLRYVAITLLSAAVNFGVAIALADGLGTSEELAYGVALITVFAMNYLFMRYYIFAGPQRGAAGQFVIYTASAVGFRTSEYLAFLVLHTWLGMHYLLAMLLILGGSFIAKFLYYGRVVFGRKSRLSTAGPGESAALSACRASD